MRKVKQKKGNGFVSIISRSWKILLTIGVALGLIGSLFSFDSRYQKEADAQQQKLQAIESFKELNKSIQMQQQQTEEKWKKHDIQDELKSLLAEEKRLYDRERSLKNDLKKNPNDKTTKDELEDVQKERDDVKKQIFDIKSKMRQ